MRGDDFEFLWRPRFKADLVSRFVQCEPWIKSANRVFLRELMVHALGECGYDCVLANESSVKARVRFPDGKGRRVTGVVVGIAPAAATTVVAAPL